MHTWMHTYYLAALPWTPYVSQLNISAEENNQAILTIYWDEIMDNTKRGITGFRTEENGQCGTCTNLGMVERNINYINCTGWMPNTGLVCNITVAAVTNQCGFESQKPLVVPIPLQSECILLCDYLQ